MAMKIIRTVTMGMLLAASVLLPSCSGSKDETSGQKKDNVEAAEESPAMKNLRKQVEQLNSTFPVEMQDGLKMTGVALEDGYLIYTCEYPANMEFEVQQDETTRKRILLSLPRPTRRMLRESGLGIKYIYVKAGTDEKQEVVITPEEISNL